MPARGPRILFFSGGTALRGICRALTRFSHNSIHLITPFDSGGSSAELRAAFSMPAVGDLRNRLISLADDTVPGNAATIQLLCHRLAKDGDPESLRDELSSMAAESHELVRCIPATARRQICAHLGIVTEHMPSDFDLRDASVGNLLLAGAYLSCDRDTSAAVDLYSKLIAVRGWVRPIAEADVTLFARTSDGRTIAGQHAITARPRTDASSLVDLWLGKASDDPTPADCEIAPEIASRIETADLICFPIGSFYTSVLANLLPKGVGKAVARARCPKVYVPNTGTDSEQRGISAAGAVDHIVRLARRDAGSDVPVSAIVDSVLVDSESGRYQAPVGVEDIEARGVTVIDRRLVDPDHPTELEASAAVDALLSLIPG